MTITDLCIICNSGNSSFSSFSIYSFVFPVFRILFMMKRLYKHRNAHGQIDQKTFRFITKHMKIHKHTPTMKPMADECKTKLLFQKREEKKMIECKRKYSNSEVSE